MVHAHLRRREQSTSLIASDYHLDDDSLAAFTEGRLSENESAPVLSHLVACSFCRHITAQLVRLDSAVGDSNAALPVDDEDPGRIRRLLDDLGSRVFPTSNDEAVFAYHSPAEDFNKDDAAKEELDEDDKSPEDPPSSGKSNDVS